MDNNQNVPNEYRVLSPWAYFGYNLLFGIPIIGFIFAIVFAFDDSNLNRKSYARSYFCGLIIAIVIAIVLLIIITALGLGTYILNDIANSL